MPSVAFMTSVCDGACGHPPSAVAQWSSNVFANSKGVVRLSDQFTTHPDGFHPGRVVSNASTKVFANSRRLARVGDDISCGAHIATGSNNVIAG